VDTEGVEPCASVFSPANVLREDTAGEPFDTEALLKNAPRREDTAYLVPKTVE
jgi:aspartyl/glutamyl-tRNA(Asn/Gln) amidotransferase C subunit